MKRAFLVLAILLSAFAAARADVSVSPLFSDNMVLQRDIAVPVWGTAEPREAVTVKLGDAQAATQADAQGKWSVKLPPIKANTTPRDLTIAGKNALTIANVLVGDVWLCGGQSNMDMWLADCDRKEDIDSANFPGIRTFRVPGMGSDVPLKTLKSNPKWMVCSPATARAFSASAFYFARKIYQETKGAIPIGLIVSSIGGTNIDFWLVPEGLVDIPVLHPLLERPIPANGPFHLANGMICPLAPYGIKGAIWYQGENAERSVQSPDSYYLKMKALQQGWQRLWGMDEFPFYFVMIANYGELLQSDAPVLQSGGWDANTRLQQAYAMVLPHSGCASAIDIGVSQVSWPGYHPKNKQDVGDRLALWALKNDYGHPDLVASGPVLSDVAVSGNTVVCSFDHVGGGLMVGSKTWYKPTQEVPDGTLKRFVIAGADGKWYPATALIKDNKVVVSSPSVPEPRKVSYACWQNPEGCNLYNKDGLPAAPFHVEDLTKRFTLTASAGEGGEISPAGTKTLPERLPARYTIKAKPGQFIQDVKVDGKSVGSVASYIFDPIHANHTIEATFTAQAPSYPVSASASDGGTVTPAGAQTVAQGSSVTFEAVTECRPSLTVDGCWIGPRDKFTFPDVRAGHTLSFAFNPVVLATWGPGGAISPSGELVLDYKADQKFTITPNPGYEVSQLMVDGAAQNAAGSYAFSAITGNHTISVAFKATDGGALLSQGKAMTASSGNRPGAAAAANDGNTDSQWVAEGGTFPQWLAVDLGANSSITRCETFCEFPANWYQYKIEYSTDNSTWKIFADRQSNKALGNPCYTDVAPAVEARYVRVTITATGGGWSAIREFKVYGKPAGR